MAGLSQESPLTESSSSSSPPAQEDELQQTTMTRKQSDGSFWYFAIGAMMNPISIKNRGFVPMESHPGELLDYKLHFFGTMGMAQAFPSEGDSFHGVLHHIDEETMFKLDQVEIEYIRTTAKARLYNGTIVEAEVYTKPESFFRGKDSAPEARYLEIMSDGAKHFGVKEEYVRFLRNHESRPRALPHEFRSFDDPPPGVTMPLEQVLIANGTNEDQPFRLTLNSKVIELHSERDGKDWKDFSGFVEDYGSHMELMLSKVVYDPKYGIPERLQDFTREHSAYIEDHMVRFVESRGSRQKWKTVAAFQQEYAD